MANGRRILACAAAFRLDSLRRGMALMARYRIRLFNLSREVARRRHRQCIVGHAKAQPDMPLAISRR